MSIEIVRAFIKEKAIEFGAKVENEFNKPFVERNNTGADALNDNGAYFGFIHPEEEVSGPFHDFSFTLFPNDQGLPWLVCLGIGSAGFKNDYELATFPGLRRLFSNLVDENGFCKSDFSDIDTPLPKSIIGSDKLTHGKNTLKTYTKVLPCCQIIDDPLSDHGKKVISAFLAGYAKLRDWASNKDHRNAIAKALEPFTNKEKKDDLKEINDLLRSRKYVVLEGPPGTGKTRASKILAQELNGEVFFTQFHAETSYSDFIFGIRPSTNNKDLIYENKLGIFSKAVAHAIENPDSNVVLIIDEINRANLSNVLGPIFYLFEYQMEKSDIEIEITPDLAINSLPKNLFVIATMNSADRSLAVVDFALRRRFAWYSLLPSELDLSNFYYKDFKVFKKYI